MLYRCNVFERGQVWMVLEDKEVSDALIRSGVRTTVYSHPWLILTPMEIMGRSPLVMAVPISSKTGKMSDDDIIFINNDGEKNKLMCNQACTKDSAKFTRYMFSLPDCLVDEVSRIVAKHIGIITNDESETNEVIVTDDSRVAELEALLEKERSDREKDYLKYKKAIKILSTPKETVEQSSEVTETEKTKEEKVKRPKKKQKSVKHRRKEYIRWTEETALEFLSDVESLDRDEIVEKWALPNRTAVGYTAKYLNTKFFN